VNVDTLLVAMPGLVRSTASSYLPLMEAAQREHNITSEMRSRMWLAQVGHESLSLRYMEEIASGAAYEGRKDLGNTQPGDGMKYKGRGPIQVTGRYNYTQAAAALGLDLVNRPEIAADPPHAFRISAWWWATHGLNEISDTGDVTAATRRINGGLNGLSDRQSRYSRAQSLGARVIVTGAPQPPTQEEMMAISAVVNGAGALHVFVEAKDGSIWYTWQRKGETSWQGGAAGKGPAGLQQFAPAPK
jgi:predicted chitinase